MSCFIAAAKTCSPATVTFTGTIDVSALFAESVQNALAIKGLNGSGRCVFSDDEKSATGIVTPQFLAGAEAQGLTAAQAQEEVKSEAQQSAGATSECTFTTSALVSLLTDWSAGPVSASAFIAGNCTSNSTSNTDINMSVPLITSTQQSLPSSKPAVAGGSTTLTAPNDSKFNNLEFNVNSIYQSQLTMTVTNHTTGESVTVTLNINQPQTIVGYTMTVTNITEVQGTNAQGQTTFDHEATLTFTQE
jgi:hypothetical protein